MQADIGFKREDQSTRTVALKAKTDPASATRAMPDVYRDFRIRDLTSQMEDGRYKACAAVVGRGGSNTLSQRFLDFGTFESEAEATARAQAGARAWVDEDMWDVPLALPTNYASWLMSEEKAESDVTSR